MAITLFGKFSTREKRKKKKKKGKSNEKMHTLELIMLSQVY